MLTQGVSSQIAVKDVRVSDIKYSGEDDVPAEPASNLFRADEFRMSFGIASTEMHVSVITVCET